MRGQDSGINRTNLSAILELAEKRADRRSGNILAKSEQAKAGKVIIAPDKNLITVTYHSHRTSAIAIKQSVSAAGYDADEVKATKEGVCTLDLCCRPGQ